MLRAIGCNRGAAALCLRRRKATMTEGSRRREGGLGLGKKVLFLGIVYSSSSSAAASPVDDALPTYGLVNIAGDGRCLFRSVHVSRQLVRGDSADDDTTAADALRAAAVSELRQRRDELSWAVEGNFDSYLDRMSSPHAWGGELELVALGHVVGDGVIDVHMPSNDDDKADAVVTSGSRSIKTRVISSYQSEGSIAAATTRIRVPVFYDGVGHYQALKRLDGDGACTSSPTSKL